jgi:EAL and modified HD-GYP domain-containing signal transduction protein
MYSTRYLGRQPIVDANQQLVAYELLFRSSQANVARVNDDVMATTAVIRHAFVDLGWVKCWETGWASSMSVTPC